MVSRLTLGVLVAVAFLGCKGPTSLSDNIVEMLSGTVQPGQSDVKTFNITNTGELNITLTALSGSTAVGIGYGQTVSAGNCGIVQQRAVNNSSIGQTVFADAIYIKGQYCTVVFDGGSLTTAQNYTLRVSHP